MRNGNAIEIRNMYKSFKIQSDRANTLKSLLVMKRNNKVERHEVLKNINLDIRKGETVCLIGNNGCGKSTLLKLMTKIIYPNQGTVQTFGKIASLLELGAGFHPDFTGRENIYFNSAVFGMNHSQIEKRLDDIIEFSELGSFIDEPIRTYSSGMYMRLAFSIAINVDADILLIDEILAVGDQHFQDKCYAKLRELKEDRDKTIVIVSHSLEVVKSLCSRAIWIYRGDVKLDGDPAYVIAEYLEQMAKDHKEEHEKAIADGKKVDFSSIVWIDYPKDYMIVEPSDSVINFQGWKLSDYPKAQFELTIGNTSVRNIEYFCRKEVITIYSEQFKGLVNEDEIGWKAVVDLKDYSDQINEDGTVKFLARITKEDGTVLTEKYAIAIYKGEWHYVERTL